MKLIKIFIPLILLTIIHSQASTSSSLAKNHQTKPKPKIQAQRHNEKKKQEKASSGVLQANKKLIDRQNTITKETKKQRKAKYDKKRAKSPFKANQKQPKNVKKKGKRMEKIKKMWRKVVDSFSSEGFLEGVFELVEQSVKFLAALILYLVSLIIFLYVFTIDVVINRIVVLLKFWPMVFYVLAYILIILSCFWCCEQSMIHEDEEKEFIQDLVHQDESSLSQL